MDTQRTTLASLRGTQKRNESLNKTTGYSDENHQLADMLASLESNLEKYEEYMKDQRAHMDAADNRGEHVVFYSTVRRF